MRLTRVLSSASLCMVVVTVGFLLTSHLLHQEPHTTEITETDWYQEKEAVNNVQGMDIRMLHQEDVRKDMLKKMSLANFKEIKKLMQTLEGMRNSEAISKHAIDLAVQAVQMRLLQEISGKSFEELLNATHYARGLSSHARAAPVRVVIATTWRSGSTFLEELLSSHPAVYNHYEPLMQFGLKQIRDGDEGQKAVELLDDLLYCRYEALTEYLTLARKIPEMISRNTFVWDVCNTKEDSSLCFSANFLGRVCRLFPWTTMKLVRIRLRLLRPLLKREDLNTKIIYLVRDPRGVINSRTATVHWCDSLDCNDPVRLCDDMQDDWMALQELQKEYPNRLFLLRYEDLALHPTEKTVELLGFLGLDFDRRMREYIATHTTKNYDKPWSTSRESAKRVTYWADKMTPEKVHEVQKACANVMSTFGYLSVNLTNLTPAGVVQEKVLRPWISSPSGIDWGTTDMSNAL